MASQSKLLWFIAILLALHLFDRLPVKSDSTEDSSLEIGIYLDQQQQQCYRNNINQHCLYQSE